jgi:hypothetical protein
MAMTQPNLASNAIFPAYLATGQLQITAFHVTILKLTIMLQINLALNVLLHNMEMTLKLLASLALVSAHPASDLAAISVCLAY